MLSVRKKGLRRPRDRWEDIIEMHLKVTVRGEKGCTGMHLTWCRNQRLAGTNVTTNLRFPLNAGSF